MKKVTNFSFSDPTAHFQAFQDCLQAHPHVIQGQRGAFGQLFPCLLSSPHSGRDYREDFLGAVHLPFHELQKMEDRFLDDLLAPLPELGLSLLQARFPRSYCDPNRNWRELDATMFRPPLEEIELTLTARVAAGFGVIPRCAQAGKTIYRECLEASEASWRLQHYWQPYHHALQALQHALTEIFGYSVLLDIHSMPPLSGNMDCDIVLGDAHGRSCAPELTAQVESLFQERGYRVRRNTPYAGGFITHTYGTLGHPSAVPKSAAPKTQHALQIEISRALYLNAATLAPGKDYPKLKAILGHVLHQTAQWSLSEAGRAALRGFNRQSAVQRSEEEMAQ